jgi:hypothetical protein
MTTGRVRGGFNQYGFTVGILMLDTRFPRIVGDMGNARTFPFPVRYHRVAGADPDRVVRRGAERLLPAFVEGARALEAEGVGAWTGYEPMSRYDLFQPSLSRLPVAVEHADRLDPSKMSFPVAEAAGLRESIYIDENVFRSDRAGVEQAVEAIAKIQRHADELPEG